MTRIRSQSFAGGEGRTDAKQLFPLLDGAQPRTVRRFTSAATTIVLPRGAVIYRAGQPSTGLYVVLAGRVKLSLPLTRSRERVLALLESGAWFGENALLLATPHVNAASAVEPTTLAHIPAPTFADCLCQDRSLAMKLLKEISRRLNTALAQNAVTELPARERVVSWLLRETARGNSTGDGAEIVVPATKRMLASELHMTPAHLSRMLEHLKKVNLIEVRARRIVVVSLARLKAERARSG